MNRIRPTLLLAATLLAIVCRAELYSQSPRIVPRHPYAIELPVYGRMECQNCGINEGIYPLPDLNGDGIREWATRARQRDSNGALLNDVRELRIYYGVRGGIPDVDDYLRIGPSEVLSITDFVAVGDWDGDSHPDIATLILVFGDSANGIPDGSKSKPMVIWWGNAEGAYSLSDTTHLQIGMQGWALPDNAYSEDWNRDGIKDLMITDIKGYVEGEIVQYGPVQIWFGHNNERWGHEQSRYSDWTWWNAPRATRFSIFGRLQWIDQDADGLLDMIEHFDGGGGGLNGVIRVRYGVGGEILDTTNVVEIDLTPAWGKYALFTDVTGDGVVPELLVNTGGQEHLKVYVGLKGQRITEQFGSGADSAHPGEPEWWGRPWASIPLPAALHDGWAAAGWSPIYALGDGGLDGVGDIWVATDPDLVFYNSGKALDSLYDGWIRPLCGGGGGIAWVGDIDGSGVGTIADGYWCPPTRGIRFIKPSKDVPQTGRFRQLPPGTEKSTVGITTQHNDPESLLNLSVHPNPSSGDIFIEWEEGSGRIGEKTGMLRITDVLGQEVLSVSLPARQQRFIWNASKTFAGRYFVTLRVNDQSQTTAIDIL